MIYSIASFIDYISDLLFIFYICLIVILAVHFYVDCSPTSKEGKRTIRLKSRKHITGKWNRHNINKMEQQQEIKLGGLNMAFPYVPYGIQKAMLSKIAVTLTNKEHSLIESPTGTGKTLVLLCAALAWQQESKKQQNPILSARLKQKLVQERLEKLKNRPCSCGRRPNRTELDELKEAKGEKNGSKYDGDDIDQLKEQALKKMKTLDDLQTSPYFSPSETEKKSKKGEPEFIVIDDDDDDEIKEVKADEDADITIVDETTVSPLKQINNTVKQPCDEVKPSQDMCRNCQAIEIEDAYMEEMGEPTAKFKVAKVPRIFYGTRTHKQITQVVRELKKTKYREDLKMTILSSRERTCINDDVREFPDRNDRCQELIKNNKAAANSKKEKSGETCPYYKDTNSMTVDFESIHENYQKDAWDIEDAVAFAKQYNLCPYYGLRSIQEFADITFCPYNYLLDPNIRKALNINLNNAVIIFDEAHNIEDICRDSASFVINTTQIDDLLTNINIVSQNYLQGSTTRDACDYFRNVFTDMKAFILRYQFEGSDNQKDGDCLARHVMYTDEMINDLTRIGLGPRYLSNIKEHLRALRGEDEDSNNRDSRKEDTQDSALNNAELNHIIQLTNVLNFMYDKSEKYCADFRMIVSKHLDRPKPNSFRNPNRSNTDVHMWQFSLICMNSGIAFEKIHSSAWSVIVASGTLAPIESLKTELGCNFSQVFEGSHVIGEDRIFSAVLSHGPNRVDLNCAYANSLRLEFQDEVGVIIRDVCQRVPNGVLCFFPSYERMETLYQRWFTRGLMKDIEKSGKKLFREQKKFTPQKFEEELNKYLKSARTKGALLFAVFRGKVSEGIDFSDEAARAVITIGIPYPNVKEITVSLKREYNDTARKTRPHLMLGSDWYAAQAFRALNQALGRCIRHKADWGAILMIDSRLRQPSSMNNISKWIRRVVNSPQDYISLQDSLNCFVQRLTDTQMFD